MSGPYQCKTCLHYTPDHYCSAPQTYDNNGRPGLARQIWYVVMIHGNGTPGCGGRFFEIKETP